MAELVHQRTEEMLNELEQLQRTGLFSGKEVKAIVKKRTKHEYKLVRRQKQKKDFLAYIQYEVDFLNLIHLRRKKEQYFFKNDEIEYVIVSRIHRIFKQATVLWASDLKLWISHANFCIKWNKRTQLNKLCTRFIQMHGNKPEHWILAAKWEIESCKSIDNGRIIFMKGIKRHPDSKKLWLEFFRAELMFAEKLRRRMKLLTPETMDPCEFGGREKRLLQGESALIAYRNALKAIADDSEFLIKFLKIATCFLGTSPFATNVIETIRVDLETLHPFEPVVKSELAKLHLNIFYGEYRESGFANRRVLARMGQKRCFDAFEDAVAAIDNEEMWGEYVQCLLFLCSEKPLPQDMILGEGENQHVRRLFDHASAVVAKAHAKRKLSSELYSPVVDFLVRLGDVDKARMMLSKISKELNDPVLLLKKIEFFFLHSVTGEIVWKPQRLFFSAYESIDKMTDEQQSQFFRLWIEFALIRNNQELAKKIATDYSSQSSDKVRSAMLITYLRWLAASGISTAYQVFAEDVCRLRTPSLEQFQIMLGICQAMPCNDVIENCFDLALHHYGSVSVELWIQYINFCQKTGEKKAKKVGDLYWRAKKNLQPSLVEEFLTRYSLLGHFAVSEAE